MRVQRIRRAPLFLLLGGVSIAAFSLTFTHIAGSFGGPGFEDGVGTAARLKASGGVAVDGSGNVYVADTGNHTIRRISIGGEVTTFAGLAESSGTTNGHGAYARFKSPQGVAVDGAGNVYVADTGNHCIRKITSSAVVSTLAGQCGTFGFVNNTGTLARFSSPYSLTLDGAGNVYVADTGNHSIRKIDLVGAVTTVAGTGSFGSTNASGTSASFYSPKGIVYEAASSSLYVADSGNRVIRQVTIPGAVVTTFAGTMSTFGHVDGAVNTGRMYTPFGITFDAASATFYVSDSSDCSIRSITSGGSLGSVAGLSYYPGPDDGVYTAARFYQPQGVAVTGSTLYVADTGNNTVRSIALSLPSSSTTTTLAGLANAAGFTNDTGSAARFRSPGGVYYYPAPDPWGYFYVSDTGNNAIRAIASDGSVTTLAGGTYGYANGNGGSAQFRSPQGIAGTFDKSAYIADTGNHCIRKVDSAGNVTLFAGQPGAPGNANGDRLTAASFNSPRAVALNPYQTVLYVADTGNYLVRAINLSSGVVSTLAGTGSFGTGDGTGTGASLGYLTGLTSNFYSGENVFAAESTTYTIRKITSGGVTSKFAGSCCAGAVDGTGTAARFGYPGPQSIMSNGYLTALVADANAHMIRSLDLGTAVVGTAGGLNGVSGTSDGTGTFARFNVPSNIGGYTTSYPVFTEGHTIRGGIPEISDRATIDSAAGLVGTARQLDMSPQTATAWTWSIIRKPAGSTATLSATNIRNPTFTPDVADLYVFRCKATSASGTSISTVSLQGNGPTTSLAVGYPGPQVAGVPFNITVTAQDQYGSRGDGYTGTIHFTSSDGTATLPADYTFTTADHGIHTFSVTMRTVGAGSRTITATDVATGSITGMNYVPLSAASANSLTLSTPTSASGGAPFTAAVTAYDAYGNVATGYRGTVQFGSSDPIRTLPSNYTFTAIDVGTHSFASGVTLNTPGSQSVTVTDTGNGALTASQNVNVALGPPSGFTARASGTTSVQLQWTNAVAASSVEIWKLAAGGNSVFTYLTTVSGTSYNDASVAANAAYAYKLRSLGTGGPSVFTAADIATTKIYTDDSLSTGGIVKAAHVIEVREAVNLVRGLTSLGASTFTDTLTPGSTRIKRIHFVELRTALDAARVQVGATAISYTDPTITAFSTKVKVAHLLELREGVR